MTTAAHPAPRMTIRRFTADMLTAYPGLFALTTMFVVVEGLVGALSLFSIVTVIDALTSADGSRPASAVTRYAYDVLERMGLSTGLATLLGAFLALQVAQNAVAICARYLVIRTWCAVIRKLLLDTFDALMSARWGFFAAQRQGTILNTLTTEMNVVGGALKIFGLMIADVVQIAFYLAVPLYLAWHVTALSVLAGAVIAAPFVALGRMNYGLGRQATASANEMTAAIQESISLAKIVFGFSRQRRSLDRLARAYDRYRGSQVRAQTLKLATPLIYEPLALGVLVTTLIGARALGVPLSETASVLWALYKAASLIGELTARRNSLLNFMPSYAQVRALRNDAAAARQTSGPRPCPPVRDAVVLDGVTFAYPGHPPVLVDVNLRIPRGKVVGIVGESGVGKSTLIDLIMGFHEPTLGRITVDGTSLSALDITTYRRRIGYVPQENALFNATIRENLAWAADGIGDAEILEACTRANAAEFIQGLPDGYDTVVGDRGVRLSGGQCQRVALARAMLGRPEILVLDEATSSLDSHSERLIQHAIDDLSRDTTVVVVTHRLSTISNADYIYVLKDGRIAEEGTYDDLVISDGHFRRMVRLQSVEAAG